MQASGARACLSHGGARAGNVFLWDRLAASAPGPLPPFLTEFAQPAAPPQPARLAGAHGPDGARPAAAAPATSAARAAAVLAVLAPLAGSIIGREVRTPGIACALCVLLHAFVVARLVTQ